MTMADDGMLVNFDIGSGLLDARPVFKGGRWKDRLTAKKAARHYHTKSTGLTKHGVQNENLSSGQDDLERHDQHGERPVKRQRLSDRTANPSISKSAASKKAVSSREGGERQVISSLFSYNPTSRQDQQEAEVDPLPAEPSNAPSKDELDTFTSLGMSATLAQHLLTKLHIKAPTDIQKTAIPQLLKEDADAFIQAQTGSGKTLAYLLPLVQKIMSISASDGVQSSPDVAETLGRNAGLFAIVIAPTRELSKQIYIVLESLLRCAHWIVAGAVTGGEKKKSEKARLRKGLNILIATPGRLADHLDNTKVLDVRNVRWLVLDEGDRLMELGFEADIEKIISKLDSGLKRGSSVYGIPYKRTTVLCSATMKMNVQKLGEMSLKDALHIQSTVSKDDESERHDTASFSAPAQLIQSYTVVPAKLRLVCLVALLKRTFARRGSVMKTMVFVSCADSVDFHFELFTRSSGDHQISSKSEKNTSDAGVTNSIATSFSNKENTVQLFKLHGSLPQSVRTSTVTTFSACKAPAVLICTDVASRGLDLPDVDFVIEYDPPFSKEDHLHRIGRTARAGKDGRAMIFLLPGGEESYVDILNASRPEGGREVTRHEDTDILRKGFSSPGLGGDEGWEDKATEWQLATERWAIENPARLEQARRAYQSHIRAYATHVSAERHMFDIASLHLGHLAKAFALRDKPGSIKVPGLRPTNLSTGKASRGRASHGETATRAQERAKNGDPHQGADHKEAARQMKSMSRNQLSGASEFNLG